MFTKKLYFLLIFVTMTILVTGCQQNGTNNETAQSNGDEKYEDYVYKKYDLDVKDKVKIGEENAENSFVLAFDYSCSWCHKWMIEILPEVQKVYIENEQANYVAQPLALLNQTSLQLSHFDYYIEKNNPERLYEFQLEMAKAADQENWGSEDFIAWILSEYEINMSLEELEKNNPDPISITRNYTKSLGVEFVPTLYINGIKVYNAFDLEEIAKIINGEIKENDVIQIPDSEE